MMFTSFRQLIAVLALLAFTGQSLAAVMCPCAAAVGSTMTGSTMPAMAADVVMDHSAHMGPASDSADTGGCCGHEQCGNTDCASATVAAVGIELNSPIAFTSVLNDAGSLSHPTAGSSALFRPPISR